MATYTARDASNTVVTFRSTLVGTNTTLVHAVAAATELGGTAYCSTNLNGTGVAVKTTGGQLYGCVAYNAGTTVAYLKVYNKASAATTTDTPTMILPLGTGVMTPVPINSIAIAFSSGISLRAVTGLAGTDATDPASNAVIINVVYS